MIAKGGPFDGAKLLAPTLTFRAKGQAGRYAWLSGKLVWVPDPKAVFA